MAVCIVTLKQPRYGLMAIVAFLPYSNLSLTGGTAVKESVAAGTIEPVQIFFLITFVAWVIHAISYKKPLVKKTPLDVPIILFFFYCLISIIWCQDFKLTTVEVMKITYNLILFFMFVAMIDDWKWFKRIIGTWLVAAIIDILLVWIFQPQSIKAEINLADSRLQGMFCEDPSIFAMYLNMTIFIALAMVYIVSSQSKKLLCIAVMPLALFTMLLMGDNSSLLSFGLSVIILGFLLSGFRKYPIYLLLLLITLIVVPILFNLSIPGFVRIGTTETGISALSARFLVWKVSLDIFLDTYMMGGGPAAFSAAVKHNQYFTLNLTSPHSIYMQILCEYGLIGIGLLVFFLLRVYKMFVRTIEVAKIDYRPMIKVLLVVLICFGFEALTLAQSLALPIIWSFLGIFVAATKLTTNSTKQPLAGYVK
jgi:O-antigen ligase